MTHPGPPKNRPRDKRRVQGAPEPKHRGAPCHRTGERPGHCTGERPGSFISRRGNLTSPWSARVRRPRARSHRPSADCRFGFSKLFRNQAFRERLNTRTGERPAIPQPRGAPSCKTSSVGGASGCRRQRPLATAPGGPHALIEPGYLQARATAAIEARKRLQGTYDN